MGRMSKETHLRVVRMYEAGHKLDFISCQLGFNLGLVQKILKDHGCKNVSVKTRRNLKDARDMLIVAAVVDEPFTTPETLKKELNLPMKTANICKRLEEHGLVCLQNNFTRELTPREKCDRVSFARRHLSWTESQWEGVVFTSESTLCCTWDRHKSAWRTVHLWNDPVYVHQLKASGYTCINVLAVVTYDGLGPLVRSDECITPEQYVDILNRTLMPYFLDGPFPDRGFLLQHDPTPTYTSDEVLGCIEANGVHALSWPPKSEDLNPIQSIWSCMKLRICKHRLDEPCPDKLWDVVKHHWDLLTKHTKIVTKLYSAIPNRLRDVIRLKGGAF
uniref:Putative transposable element n=1 Tax=Ixodes ricinus TaxID=34613 RepID=A0A6B0V7W7_IXORI